MNKAYFEILSVEFSEETEELNVPEQKITNSYKPQREGLRSPGFPAIDVDTIIPAYIRPYHIRKTDMEIRVFNAKENESSLAAQEVINNLNYG